MSKYIILRQENLIKITKSVVINMVLEWRQYLN